MESTIYESFILPSKGMAYDKNINPNVTLRSMTTLEEMQRLSQTDTPYKVMSDIIEGCMKDKPEIHVYDMCIGDYQFLLHKLRIITYGADYKMNVKCPECGAMTTAIGDLESLELTEWDDSLVEKRLITLPRTNRVVELNFQTPRHLDVISYKNKEMRKKTKKNMDYSLLFTLASIIKTVDGQKMESYLLEEFIKSLPMQDVNFILNQAKELNDSIGLDATIKVKCSACGEEFVCPFRITPEFYGPTNY